ncbi:MAG TPA: hypothetical protein VMJ72_03100 [Candidatus Paceibacterota bacterium]|nr:hypothetical protein [Candidatus Paceibacterota bacterium]
MTNAEKLAHIKTWQESGVVHPLTCGADTCRQNLVGREVDGTIVLACPDCSYVQEYIPDVVLSDYAKDLRDALFPPEE